MTFELTGPGGGIWTLSLLDEQVTVTRVDSGIADCRMTASVDDFCAIVRGELDSLTGFESGRLRLEGDVGLLTRLARALLSPR